MARYLRISWLSALIITAFVYGTAVIGSLFTTVGMFGWYQNIAKPPWTPSGSVIGIVWTILFTLTAMAGILAWNMRPRSGDNIMAMEILGINLLLNMLWTYIFFMQHSINGALLEMVLLWLSILAAIVVFRRLNRVAGLLLLPYILWVSFAFYLNWAIAMLNRAL
ncbi:MAG: TspO/MBR family protein [bacterium]|jgi:benzodiazapine receptor|nr:tryptophan-rich sensory protein [bacterium]